MHKDQMSMRLMISLMVLKEGRKQQMEAKNQQRVMKRKRVMLLMTPLWLMHTYCWHVHTVHPTTATWRSTDKSLERKCAKDVAALAAELDIPHFLSLLHYFFTRNLIPLTPVIQKKFLWKSVHFTMVNCMSTILHAPHSSCPAI